jgi:rare lipoprotein A
LARYTGRHARQPQRGSWRNKERSHPKTTHHLLPAVAAFAVAGLLIGGGSLVIKFGTPSAAAGTESAYGYDAADYPPADRDAQSNRISRDDVRLAGSAANAPTNEPTATPKTSAVTVGKPPVTPATTSKTKTPVLGDQLGNASVISTGSCEASYYDEPQQTANGETFDPTMLTAAHKTLPFNTLVRVTNVKNGKSVVVRINDRGPYTAGRCLDLSSAAFGTIASLGAGIANVKYEVLGQDAA